jgi:crotonobetainyl-CoA:carnitine CoA-transferase CaiB-like acyl-CoA transferase
VDGVLGGQNFREFQGLLAQKFLTQTNAELMEFFDKNDLPVW